MGQHTSYFGSDPRGVESDQCTVDDHFEDQRAKCRTSYILPRLSALESCVIHSGCCTGNGRATEMFALPQMDDLLNCTSQVVNVTFWPAADEDQPGGTPHGFRSWRDWMQVALHGRRITLLAHLPEGSDQKGHCYWSKVPALLLINGALTSMTIFPTEIDELLAITIRVDNLRAVCPANSAIMFFRRVEDILDESEYERVVLLQYLEDSQRKYVCFLEESARTRDLCMQALIELWQEWR